MTEVAAEDLELAREVRMKPLAKCVVAGDKPAVLKASRRAKKVEPQAVTA